MNSIKKSGQNILWKLVGLFIKQIGGIQNFLKYNDPASQLLLKLRYKELANSRSKLPGIKEVGFKAYSQSDEDGILLYIFSIIGTKNKKSVEICAGNGIECNTANLIINHGWYGLLVDGNKQNVEEGIIFYKRNPNTNVCPPIFVQTWVKRSNVNKLLTNNGFKGEIDLLSIDLDGVDYWIWDAIDAIKPRVVVVEYQNCFGSDKALTIPYSDTFDKSKLPKSNGYPNFFGASLLAFTKLAKKKGYRLIGCNKYNYNAFFILKNLGRKPLPSVKVDECLESPFLSCVMNDRYNQVKNLPWVKV